MSLADLASQVQTLTDNQKELSKVVSGNQEWTAQKFLSQERSSVIGSVIISGRGVKSFRLGENLLAEVGRIFSREFGFQLPLSDIRGPRRSKARANSPIILTFNTVHAESPYQAIFKTPLISYDIQKQKKIFVHRYQTAEDTAIRKACYTLRSAKLLDLVTVNVEHLTCGRRTPADPLVPLLSKEAALSLFDSHPADYETASKILFPGVRVIAANPEGVTENEVEMA